MILESLLSYKRMIVKSWKVPFFVFIQGVFNDYTLAEVKPFPGVSEFVMIGNFKEQDN